MNYLSPTNSQCKKPAGWNNVHSFHELVLDFYRLVLPLLYYVLTLLLRRLDALLCLCPEPERFFSAAVAVRKQSAPVHLEMFHSILVPLFSQAILLAGQPSQSLSSRGLSGSRQEFNAPASSLAQAFSPLLASLISTPTSWEFPQPFLRPSTCVPVDPIQKVKPLHLLPIPQEPHPLRRLTPEVDKMAPEQQVIPRGHGH